jgi:hypothetical protein
LPARNRGQVSGSRFFSSFGSEIGGLVCIVHFFFPESQEKSPIFCKFFLALGLGLAISIGGERLWERGIFFGLMPAGERGSPMNCARSVCLGAGLVFCWAAGARGQARTFINDFDAWSLATGVFSTIDFETLPDGSPSVAGTAIAGHFNYTDWGVTFSAPKIMGIAGNSSSGFGLLSFVLPTDPDSTHIRADLVIPASSIGFFFPGSATVEVFGTTGDLLATAGFNSSGSGLFLGAVSEIPIGYVIMDENPSTSTIESFHFASTPEPGTVGLLGLGGLAFLRRRGRRDGSGVGRGWCGKGVGAGG